MSNITKPAKLITKLIDQRKADAATIAELSEKLAAAAGEAAAARRAEDLASAGLEATRAAAQAELEATRAAAQAELEATRAVMEAERVVARENADILDKLQPQIDALEIARVDLTKLCDDVRARMKRRELEAERAILNRQALAGSRPGLNRG